MPYPQEFFAVQLAFAHKMADLTQTPYHEAILYNTAFYRILGLDWSFDPQVARWQTYLADLQQNDADLNWTYQFYLNHLEDIPEYTKPRWGCFAYEYEDKTQVIRMHFSGKLDSSGYGPLTSLRKGARLAELKSMFTHIQERHPQARRVHGGSWLYNRQEYIRLFPPEYGQSAHADAKPHLRARGLWGQFLRYDDTINRQIATLFQERLARLHIAAAHPQCFPYQAMLTGAPITHFYTFYDI